MIDPNSELLKWGPIDGLPVYIEWFMDAFADFPDYFDGSWPDCIAYMKDRKNTCIVSYEGLRQVGAHLFNKYVLDKKEDKRVFSFWKKTTEQTENFVEKVRDLSKLNSQELALLLKEWDSLHKNFWCYGFIPELSNWGAEQMLKEEVNRLYPGNVAEIMEALAAPEDLSFFKIEEIDFLKIKLIKDRKKQQDAIKAHQQKYFWLHNSYGHCEVLEEDYFREELGKISEQEAQAKLKEIEEYPKKVKEKKAAVIRKYKIPADIRNIASNLCYTIWWQDLRKKYIFISNHIILLFAKELAKRNKISLEDIEYYARRDLLELASSGVKVTNVADRKQCYISYYHERGRLSYMFGRQADEFIKPYLEVRVNKGIREIKGIVVSKGRAKGAVKVLFTPKKDMAKMKKGDVLVAPMTSPDYVRAMRLAGAIITDEGGMTCHAAIVSRELGIPCIVGTKIATKVLKDGDIVEVDADKGIVRRIS